MPPPARAESASRRPPQVFRDLLHRPRRRPPALIHQLLRRLTHPTRTLRIAQQLNPSHARVLGTFHLHRRLGRHKSRRHLRKIFHRRTKHRNLSKRRRLQNVVPAGLHQRSADERAIGQSIQRRQLSDRIQEQHRHVRRNCSRSGRRSVSTNLQLRPPNELSSRLLNKIRRLLKTLRLSRRQDKQRVRKLTLHHAKRNQSERLFTRYDTSRYNQRPPAAALHFTRQPLRHRRRIRHRLVILQIPAHRYALGRRAQFLHAFRIPRTLHQERQRMPQRAPQKRPEIKSRPRKKFLISRKRLIRNPPADKNHRHLAPVGLAQKIRPNLRLQHNHQRGLHRIQRPPHTKRPIEWKINHGVGHLHTVARQRLPRLRCSGNNQRPLRIRCF